MRVSNQAMSNMMVGYILNNRSGIYHLQEQISSGKRVLKPSDDPGAYDLIALLKQNEACLKQYTRNAEGLKADLNAADNALQQVSDILHRISELAVSAGNGTTSPADRKDMGAEVNQLLEEMVNQGNASEDGRFLFAGLRTDTPPYAVTRNAEGLITAITYQGNAEVRQVEVGRGNYIAVNVPGTDTAGGLAAFQSQDLDIFNNLIQLRDRLYAGENLVQAAEFSADPATDTLTLQGIYKTGSLVQLSSTGTLPAGLDANTKYYAIVTGPNQIQLATSLANARAGIAVDFTDAGSGTHSLNQLSLEECTQAIDQITNMLAVFGAREERLDIAVKILAQRELDVADTLNDLESVDVAKAVTDLTNKKTAYEASLQITGAMLGTSLLDYI